MHKSYKLEMIDFTIFFILWGKSCISPQIKHYDSNDVKLHQVIPRAAIVPYVTIFIAYVFLFLEVMIKINNWSTDKDTLLKFYRSRKSRQKYIENTHKLFRKSF